jgi:hypothetical protein
VYSQKTRFNRQQNQKFVTQDDIEKQNIFENIKNDQEIPSGK